MKRKDILSMKDPPNGLLDQLFNAGIHAGYTFFSTLVGLGAAGLLADIKTGLLAAFIASGFVFFGSLMTQRGLQKPSQPT